MSYYANEGTRFQTERETKTPSLSGVPEARCKQR